MYDQGRAYCLALLGFTKEAASATSTILPRLAENPGVAMHLEKLKGLRGADVNALGRRVNTKHPTLMYESVMQGADDSQMSPVGALYYLKAKSEAARLRRAMEENPLTTIPAAPLKTA